MPPALRKWGAVAGSCSKDASGGKLPVQITDQPRAAPELKVALIPSHCCNHPLSYLSGHDAAVGAAAPVRETLV